MAGCKEEGDAVAQTQESSGISMKLCPELKAFYDRHGVVDAEAILDADAQHSMRFVRLNPRHDKAETLSLLRV